MQQYRSVWPWPARLVWAFFLGLTFWMVFADVLQHGAPITTKHAFTFGVLLGTYYFGHMAWPLLKQWRIIPGVLSAAIALVGSYLVLFSSAGRNAEAIETKTVQAREHNAERASLAKSLKHAESERDKAGSYHADMIEAQLVANKAAIDACKDGKGPLCRGAEAKAEQAGKAVAAAQASKQLAEEAYWLAYGKLTLTKPAQIEDADIHQMAALLVKLPWISASQQEIEAMHKLGIPIGMSAFAEAGLLLAAAIRVRVPVNPGHPAGAWILRAWARRRSDQFGAEATETTGLKAIEGPKDGGAAAEPAPQPEPLPDAPRAPSGKMSEDEAKAYVLTQLALGRGIHGQAELAKIFGVSGSTAHDWIKRWKADGLITTAKIGKANEIRAAKAPA